MEISRLAADVILAFHFAFVGFVVGGVVLTWIGALLRWNWVRNFWFRIAHLTAVCFVAAEALLGIMCPLTIWEDALRGDAAHASFIARWIHRLMFYELPEWIFTVAYVAFAGLVLVTYRFMPPAPRTKTKKAP
jgi:hypothetical protein